MNGYAIPESKPVLALSFDWKPIGSVSLGANGRLCFPVATSAPGLYLFELVQGGARSHYAGEAENLARRFQHYRTPGPSQHTNIRLNRLMIDTLGAAGRISVSVVTSGATINIQGENRPMNFASKHERVLLEHATISVINEIGSVMLNR